MAFDDHACVNSDLNGEDEETFDVRVEVYTIGGMFCLWYTNLLNTTLDTLFAAKGVYKVQAFDVYNGEMIDERV